MLSCNTGILVIIMISVGEIREVVHELILIVQVKFSDWGCELSLSIEFYNENCCLSYARHCMIKVDLT